MLVPLRSFGSGGIATLSDAQAQDLKANVFTDGESAGFRDRAAQKAEGYLNAVIDFVEDAFWFQGWETDDLITIAFGMEDQIYTTTDGQYVNQAALLDQAGAGMSSMTSTTTRWQSEVFGKFCLMNNGSDIPVYSVSHAAGPPSVWTFREIPGWGAASSPTGAVSVIRAAYNHLIALGVEDFPYTVFTSVRGSPEAFPTSWDYGTPGTLAKRFPVQSSDGPLVDGGLLNGRFIIYQRYACGVLDYVGGNNVFNFRRLLDVGLCNREAFASFENYHLVVGEREIVIHDGSSITRVDDNRVRTRFFGEVSDLSTVKCTTDPEHHEVLIHYNGDRLLIYNYLENTWAFEDIGRSVARIARAIGPEAPTTWDELTVPWDSLTVTWDSFGSVDRVTRLYQLQTRSLDRRNIGYRRQGDDNAFALEIAPDRILIEGSAGSGDRLILEVAELEEYDGWLARSYVDLDELVGEATRLKRVHAMYLQAKGGGTFAVQIGTSRSLVDTVKWGPVRELNFTDEPSRIRIGVRQVGRYLHWRFGSWGEERRPGWWELTGADLEVTVEGRR